MDFSRLFTNKLRGLHILFSFMITFCRFCGYDLHYLGEAKSGRELWTPSTMKSMM